VTTLIVDTGDNLVGIFSVEDGQYTPYRGAAISEAIHRIETAEEVVTYNGKFYDLDELGKFAKIPGALPLKGRHTDMRSICWSDRIWGRSLYNTYLEHFIDCPSFPDTHEGNNNCDVYMTFKLWELWKQEKLKFWMVNGSHRTISQKRSFINQKRRRVVMVLGRGPSIFGAKRLCPRD
jgi:hypothetical protein